MDLLLYCARARPQTPPPRYTRPAKTRGRRPLLPATRGLLKRAAADPAISAVGDARVRPTRRRRRLLRDQGPQQGGAPGGGVPAGRRDGGCESGLVERKQVEVVAFSAGATEKEKEVEKEANKSNHTHVRDRWTWRTSTFKYFVTVVASANSDLVHGPRCDLYPESRVSEQQRLFVRPLSCTRRALHSLDAIHRTGESTCAAPLVAAYHSGNIALTPVGRINSAKIVQRNANGLMSVNTKADTRIHVQTPDAGPCTASGA
ncbi:unnamed protein product [Lota lota]